MKNGDLENFCRRVRLFSPRSASMEPKSGLQKVAKRARTVKASGVSPRSFSSVFVVGVRRKVSPVRARRPRRGARAPPPPPCPPTSPETLARSRPLFASSAIYAEALTPKPKAIKSNDSESVRPKGT